MPKAVSPIPRPRRSVRAILRATTMKHFGNNPFALGWIRRVYVGLGMGEKNEIDYLFDFSRRAKDLFVLQVGANDGKRHDFLRPFLTAYRWHGLLLEPLPDIFTDLRGTYTGCENVTLVNAALADRDGELPFYRVKPGNNVPDGCHELGSFCREVVEKHVPMFPGAELTIEMEPVRAYSFKSLAEAFGINRLDIVVIDTEGYDFEILKFIDFKRLQPRLVIFEHVHLSHADQLAATVYLKDLGYTVHRLVKSGDANTLAVRN